MADEGVRRGHRENHGAQGDDAARVRAADGRRAAVVCDEDPLRAGEHDREDDGGDGRRRRL